MAQTDASRIFTQEGAYTFNSKHLDELIKELDARISCADMWSTITRVSGLLSKVEYFSDAAKTQKVIERNFTRTVGFAGIKYITEIETIFYNLNGSEDSKVITTITRDSIANESFILECASPFTTTENTKL